MWHVFKYTCTMVYVPMNRNTEGKDQHWMSSSIAIALYLFFRQGLSLYLDFMD